MSAPTRSRAARLGRHHLCVDIRDTAFHWARAQATRDGMRVTEWGTVPRDEERPLEEQLHAAFGAEPRVEVGLRSAQLVHERTVLPSISPSEAQSVAERRCEHLDSATPGEATVVHTTRLRNDATALWLAGVPTAEAEAAVEQWRAAGITPSRLQSRHLALGQLVHFRNDVDEGELIAIFDLESEAGTCVLADRTGWLFSREVPLRFLGRTRQSAETVWLERADAIEIDDEVVEALVESIADEEAQNAEPELELASPAAAEALESTPQQVERRNAESRQQAELLATELRRTFRYVQGHLDTGPVARIWLTGVADDIETLASALSRELTMPVQLLEWEGAEAPALAAASAAIGMAHAADRRGGNLLPADVRQALRSGTAKRRVAVGIVTAAALVLALGAGLGLQYGTLRARAEQLEREWEKVEIQRAQMAKVRAARSRAQSIEEALAAIDGDMPSWTQLFRTLGHTIPDTAAVQQLSGARAGDGWDLSIAVEASGDTMAHAAQSISDFAQQIEAAPFATIDEIQRESAAADPTAATNRVRFRLQGRLAPVEPIRAPGAEREGSDA